MRIFATLAVILGALALPAAAQSPTALGPTVSPSPVHLLPKLVVAPAPVGGALLTKADADAFLDGFVPYAIDQADIAGGVVVVVKDGQVLTERGFGYSDIKSRKPVDPETTMFRPGSTSKLFTWTSVMQLVQAGKLDLDRDVNDYLDFRFRLPSASRSRCAT